MPLLQKYNFPATAFITDLYYREGFTWEGTQALASVGWEIGWYTLKHTPADSLQRSDIVDDFSQAAPLFESHGLLTPTMFASPSGIHNSLSREVASEYFLASRTMETGGGNQGGPSKRVGVYPRTKPALTAHDVNLSSTP